MKKQFKLVFLTDTRGADVPSRNERELPLDKPIAEIMAVLEELTTFCTQIVIEPEAVERLAASPDIADHVKQMAELPESQHLQLSFGARAGRFGYTLNEKFSGELPGLPLIVVEQQLPE